MTGHRIVITGAAGSLAADIIPPLLDAGYTIVGVDRRRGTDPRLTWVTCTIDDEPALEAAFAGAAAIIHLAGLALEAPWARISAINIDGTQSVLEAARRAGVPRAVLASSIHVAGFTPIPASGRIPDETPVRPDTFYGVGKAALEALGALYHHRYGMDVLCLRIASRFARPSDARMLSTWLSPADAARLFRAALEVPDPGYRIVWGVSDNTRSVYSQTGGAAIGFRPRDDAEYYAPGVSAASGSGSAAVSWWDGHYIGGVFCSPDPPRQADRTVAGGRARVC